MPWVYNISQPFAEVLDLGCRYLPWIQDMSGKVREFRNGFVPSSSDHTLFWACTIVFGVFLFCLSLYSHYKKDKVVIDRVVNNPDQLFWNLLNQIQLPESDKKLLHQMTTEARLIHPASALLSPKTLDWARNLWIQEKGKSAIPPEKLRRINEISVLLYDQYPSQPNPDLLQSI